MHPKRALEGTALSCTVVSLGGSDGALATADGITLPIRVANGVPGDRGSVRVLHSGQHGAWTRWLHIDEPSLYRRAAECSAVARCGGCPWQMVDVELQRETRLQRLKVSLAKWLSEPVARQASWATLLPMTVGYRSRAQVVLGRKRGRIVWGFWAPGSQELVAVDLCPVHLRSVDQVINRAADELDRAGIAVAEEGSGPTATGLIWRSDPRSEQGLLTVLCSDPQLIAPAAQRLAEIPGVVGVFAAPVARKGGPAVGDAAVLLAGEPRAALTWRFRQSDLPELTLELGATAFVQTRHDAAESLVEAVAAMLPKQGQGLLDLYSGVGVFGLALRDRFAKVWLAERDGPAMEDARHNAALLQADHAEICCGDAATVLDQLLVQGAPFSAAVVDPPRAGCGQAVVDRLSDAAHLTDIAYVSCGQAGLERDVGAFAARGWQVAQLLAIDMFPHTPHAEAVVHLRRTVS